MATMQFSTAISALGREAVVYLPTVAAPQAVTEAEINAASAIMLTCNWRGFNPTAEQSKTKKYRHCSKQGFDQLGRTDWTIERPTFIDDPQALDTSTGYPHKSLLPGTKGFLLRRRGLDADPAGFEPFESGQRYDIFPVEFGVRVPVPVAAEEDGQEFEYMQEIAVTGTRREGVIAAA